MLLFYIFIMRTVTAIGLRIIPACHNELTPIKPLLENGGMDTRNNTKTEPSLSDISNFIYKKRMLDYLQDPRIGQLRKVALAELVLDEYLYPNERLSKFTMSPMAGGLFRGWDDDED
jgi:hypothetical protein